MRKGFTLVELSIVLIIIGLLTGGILVAQSMIGSAKIVGITKKVQQYEIAVNNFKVAYKTYPGDSPFFNPPGTGDNRLYYGAAGVIPCNGTMSNYEYWHTFTHLSQAGMLADNYVPYAPLPGCGGTQSAWDHTAGLTAPFTNLDSKGAVLTTVSKYPIYGNKQLPESFYSINLRINPGEATPLQTKIGFAPFDNNGVLTSPGMANTLNPGNCYDASYATVSCNSPSAALAIMTYYVQPI